MICICEHSLNDHDANGVCTQNCDCESYLDINHAKFCKACAGRGHDWKGDDCHLCKGIGYVKKTARELAQKGGAE